MGWATGKATRGPWQGRKLCRQAAFEFFGLTTRQRKILERVEETFRQQGYVVMNLSTGEVYKTTPNL
jgi:hypothetical protein